MPQQVHPANKRCSQIEGVRLVPTVHHNCSTQQLFYTAVQYSCPEGANSALECSRPSQPFHKPSTQLSNRAIQDNCLSQLSNAAHLKPPSAHLEEIVPIFRQEPMKGTRWEYWLGVCKMIWGCAETTDDTILNINVYIEHLHSSSSATHA